MQYLVMLILAAAVVLVPGSLVMMVVYAGYRLWKRKRIERIIRKHEESGAYEEAEHFTSHIDLDD